MTVTSVPGTVDVRRPAWLLLLTLPGFVAFLALASVTIATQTDASAAELTPAQLDDLGIALLALHLLWIAPSLVAALALAILVRTLRLPRASAVTVLAGGAVVLALAYITVQMLASGTGGTTWGDSALYPLGVAWSLAIGWFGTLPATILVCAALARRGVARITAWTVAALAGLYLAFELLVYLTVLFGAATLEETAGLPPFLLGCFWAALGVGLLRSRVSSSA
jgi:hypothetical protein